MLLEEVSEACLKANIQQSTFKEWKHEVTWDLEGGVFGKVNFLWVPSCPPHVNLQHTLTGEQNITKGGAKWPYHNGPPNGREALALGTLQKLFIKPSGRVSKDI